MSRKAAYALRARDCTFAQAWDRAVAARRPQPVEGDKPDRAARSTSSTAPGPSVQAEREAALRDRYFAQLAANRRSSAPARNALGVARSSPGQ